MRQSEGLGLQWPELDLDAALVRCALATQACGWPPGLEATQDEAVAAANRALRRDGRGAVGASGGARTRTAVHRCGLGRPRARLLHATWSSFVRSECLSRPSSLPRQRQGPA